MLYRISYVAPLPELIHSLFVFGFQILLTFFPDWLVLIGPHCFLKYLISV